MGIFHISKLNPQTGQELFAGRIEVHRVRPEDRRWPYFWENVWMGGISVALGRGRGRRRGTLEATSPQNYRLALWELTGNAADIVVTLYEIPFHLIDGQLASGNGYVYSSANPQFRGEIRWNTLI